MSFRVPPEAHADLQREADAAGTSVSDVVRLRVLGNAARPLVREDAPTGEVAP